MLFEYVNVLTASVTSAPAVSGSTSASAASRPRSRSLDGARMALPLSRVRRIATHGRALRGELDVWLACQTAVDTHFSPVPCIATPTLSETGAESNQPNQNSRSRAATRWRVLGRAPSPAVSPAPIAFASGSRNLAPPLEPCSCGRLIGVDDEEAEPEVARVDVAVAAEVGAPGLASLEEAVLVAGEVLVRVREVEGGLDRVRLVARVDQADAHRVVGDEQRVLALAVEVVRVPGEEALDHAVVGAAALAVHGRRLHGVAVDVPEPDLPRRTGVDAVAPVRVEDVDAARAADADLVLQVDVIPRRRRCGRVGATVPRLARIVEGADLDRVRP